MLSVRAIVGWVAALGGLVVGAKSRGRSRSPAALTEKEREAVYRQLAAHRRRRNATDDTKEADKP